MKTTIEIHDELLIRAKRYAAQTGRTLRAVVEEGLRIALAAPASSEPYRLPDLSVGDPTDDDPLEAYSWQDLSEIIYEHPGDPEP
ncbi:MAG: type II toxin-antitoxin system VapB family antitoxin [Gemmatimonadetes bacterium]|nr:type II toxin-antitoxin system VapB family antitoxin [Gemmatimonadota bacterium]